MWLEYSSNMQEKRLNIFYMWGSKESIVTWLGHEPAQHLPQAHCLLMHKKKKKKKKKKILDFNITATLSVFET